MQLPKTTQIEKSLLSFTNLSDCIPSNFAQKWAKLIQQAIQNLEKEERKKQREEKSNNVITAVELEIEELNKKLRITLRYSFRE